MNARERERESCRVEMGFRTSQCLIKLVLKTFIREIVVSNCSQIVFWQPRDGSPNFCVQLP